jgi:hypothetical protein
MFADLNSVVPNSVAEVAETLARIGENSKLWRVRQRIGHRI